MELKVELNKNELVEIAKLAFIAQYVLDSSGTFSEGYRYPDWETFKNALNNLYKALFPLIPDSGLVEEDHHGRNIFTHTIKMEKELIPVLVEFSQELFLEQVCKEITDRDYSEDYGGTPEMEIIGDNSVYDILYQNNWKELKQNGLKNLRLQ